MGTTKTAFQNDDGIQVCFVVAIEGYEYLITDLQTPSGLFVSGTGWHGTGWSSAVGGLVLEGVVFGQAIVPWDNKIKGNEMSFSVMDYDGSDRFGIDVFKNGAGNETELHSTLVNDATTIEIKDSTNLASSGAVYIGTERIDYTGKTTGTPHTLTGCTRGMYSPFLADDGDKFGRNHSVALDKDTVPINPKASDVPRNWIGKWCGVWMHKISGGTVDTKANAELLHAGKIKGIQDSSTGNTVVSLGSVLGAIQSATFFDDQFVARIQPGILIDPDFNLNLHIETFDSGNAKLYDYDQNFNAATASISEGSYYEIEEFVDIFNEWLLGHSTAGTPTMPEGYHARLTPEWGGMKFVLAQLDYSEITNGTVYYLAHALRGRRPYMQMLGFADEGIGVDIVRSPGNSNETEPNNMIPDFEPIRSRAFQGGASSGEITLQHSTGTWVNNQEFLPTTVKQFLGPSAGGDWGILSAGDVLFVAKRVSDTNFIECSTIPELSKTLGAPFASPISGGVGDVRYSEGGTSDIKQVLMLEGNLKDIIARLLSTTGKDAFNHATYDEGTTWGAQLGAAIPYSLLNSEFENTLDGLFFLDNRTFCVIEEATTFEKLFLGDLTLRGIYMIFRNGKVQFTAPQSPSAALTVHTLTEDNKAVPSGNDDLNRTPTQITGEYIRNVLKISYNRLIKSPDTYTETKTFKFKTSIDDYGERKAITVKSRNTYTGVSFGNGVEEIATYCVSYLLPTWGRPMQRLRRTIDLSLYLDVAPGDICTITDSFARDSETGTRGLSSKPAMILSHSFAVTGALHGEVDLLILPIDNITVYCPTGYVNEAATNSGYNAGTSTLTLRASEYSPNDTATDSTHFEAGDLITIEEVSPSDPASTTSWDRVVDSVGANTIVLTVALSSPAWDTAKQYQVFAQSYSNATATQRNDVFQSDDFDYRVENLRNPYHFANSIEGDLVTVPNQNQQPEKHSNSWFGDGVALTSANHHNLGRMNNNLIGFKTAAKGSVMFPTGTAITGTTTANFQIQQVFPVYVGVGSEAFSGPRLITVSPFMKTSIAGQLVYVRVTISRNPPTCDTTTAATLFTHEFQEPFAQLTFSTVAASYSAITAQTMPCIYNTGTGVAYVTIETKGSGSGAPVYWGLTRFEIGKPGVVS